MQEELLSLKNNAIYLISQAGSLKELEELSLQLMGRSGSLTTLLRQLPTLSKEEKPSVGRLANEVKMIIEDTVAQRKKELNSKSKQNRQKIDVTEPGLKPPLGSLHLTTQAIREITEIFSRIGLQRVRYPEISWDWYNFTALNFPENHPARDDLETFYIDATPNKAKEKALKINAAS